MGKGISLAFVSVVVVASTNEVRKGHLLLRQNILPLQGEVKQVKRMVNGPSPNSPAATPNILPLSTKFGPPSTPVFFNSPKTSLFNQQNLVELQYLKNQYQLNDPKQQRFINNPFNQEQQQLFNNNRPLNHEQQYLSPDQFNGYFGPYNKP